MSMADQEPCYICRDYSGPLLRSDCLRYCNCWYHHECVLLLPRNSPELVRCPMCRLPDPNRPFLDWTQLRYLLPDVGLVLLGTLVGTLFCNVHKLLERLQPQPEVAILGLRIDPLDALYAIVFSGAFVGGALGEFVENQPLSLAMQVAFLCFLLELSQPPSPEIDWQMLWLGAMVALLLLPLYRGFVVIFYTQLANDIPISN